ncbi:hypothetical protein [Pseudarthrobacter sp. C4D7]|uniref:hypothetical protein n=1 Tax=Pseudarthrobacter sp. C4D7 TaxID=2735268 RepID=UPI001585ADEF|nr:hypothetical protein [Pseudarthrobacter sp. C4D7]NUT72734.1 hypothetical protein [Pseudarthrobacter sp. C4D7]
METNQKLLVLANGFLAALAARGVTHIATDNIAFEGPFLSAWRKWQPTVQSPEVLPKIEFGAVNQPRNIIFRVDRSTSPFKNFRSEGINRTPHNSTPEEFLEDWCSELPISDWLSLADLFLLEVEARNTRPADRS